MRTFIAITIPTKLQQIIADIHSELKTFTGNKVNWTRPYQSHLTIKFLGQTEKRDIPIISKCLGEIATGYSPVKLCITSTGGFPNMRNPRTIWLGVDGGDTLTNIHASVDKSILTLGFDPESSKYHPHLTLGRIKRLEEGSKMLEKLLSITIPPFEWMASDIKLISSLLTPAGAIYKTLHTATFL